MVSDTFGAPCGRFPGLRSVQKMFRADLPLKNMIFQCKSINYVYPVTLVDVIGLPIDRSCEVTNEVRSLYPRNRGGN